VASAGIIYLELFSGNYLLIMICRRQYTSADTATFGVGLDVQCTKITPYYFLAAIVSKKTPYILWRLILFDFLGSDQSVYHSILTLQIIRIGHPPIWRESLESCLRTREETPRLQEFTRLHFQPRQSNRQRGFSLPVCQNCTPSNKT
jgi:hypothetical protein